LNFDGFVKSSKTVMPDLIRHPEVIGVTGFQLQFIPHLMRGRNDVLMRFLTFYEFINFGFWSFVFVSDFVLRVSNFRENNLTKI